MIKTLKTIIYWAPIAFILMFVFIFPLLFSGWFLTYNVFELQKAVYLWPATLIFLFFTLLKILVFDINIKKYLNNYFIIAIFLFLLFLILHSLFVADNLNSAIFGDYNRRQGLLTQASYLFVFVLTVVNLLFVNNIKRVIKYLMLSISLSGFLVAIYGFLQYIGLDIFVWQEAVSASRIISTIGQPNFLASFLLLTLSTSIALVFKETRFYWRLVFLINIFFHFLAIYLTSSRAAFLALFITIITVLFVLVKKRRLKVIFSISVALAIVISLGFFANRLPQAFDQGPGSFLARAQFYKASSESISAKPVFGYGLEQTGDEFVSHYKSDWALFSTVNDYPDRAHNIVLDIILNFGFLGILIYISLTSLFIYHLIYKNEHKKNWFVIIVFGLFAYIISLFFSFSALATSLYFWVLLAFLTAYYLSFKDQVAIQQLNLKTKKNLINKIILIIFLLFNLILIYIAIDNSIRSKKADNYFFLCHKSMVYNNLEDFNYCLQAENLSYDRAQKDYYREHIVNYIIDNYKQLTKETDFNFLDYLNNSYYLLNEDKYSSNFSQAKLACFLEKEDYREKFNDLVKLSPKRPAIYRAKADCYFRLKDYEKSILYYKKALKQLPDIYDQRINRDHQNSLKHYSHLLLFSIGKSHLELENNSEAIEYFRQAYYNYPYNNKLKELINN